MFPFICPASDIFADHIELSNLYVYSAIFRLSCSATFLLFSGEKLVVTPECVVGVWRVISHSKATLEMIGFAL